MATHLSFSRLNVATTPHRWGDGHEKGPKRGYRPKFGGGSHAHGAIGYVMLVAMVADRGCRWLVATVSKSFWGELLEIGNKYLISRYRLIRYVVNMKNFFLVTTKHLEEALWFRDDGDFAVGMNYVAIVAYRHKGMRILFFILMSNHVHFVVYGEYEDVLDFINDFKGRYSHYYALKYGINNLLLDNEVKIKVIDLNDEGLEWTGAYVMMNCVAANICSHPSQYKWGSGNLVFNPSRPSGRPLTDFSRRALRRMLHSKTSSLPKRWTIGEDGFILPQNYIDVGEVEQIFRKVSRLNFFLNNSSKAKKRLDSDEKYPAFKDQVVLSALPDLLRSLFGKKSFGELSVSEKVECIRQIRFRFSADITQAARVCGISYSEAAKLIDSA